MAQDFFFLLFFLLDPAFISVPILKLYLYFTFFIVNYLIVVFLACGFYFLAPCLTLVMLINKLETSKLSYKLKKKKTVQFFILKKWKFVACMLVFLCLERQNRSIMARFISTKYIPALPLTNFTTMWLYSFNKMVQ